MRWLGSIVVFLSIGCESIVELDFPGGYESKLVVNSEFSPDSIWTVYLHKSVPYARTVEWEDHYVTEAKVTISNEDGVSEKLIHRGAGVFESALGLKPLQNVGYILRVDAAPLQSVTASSQAPELTAVFHSIRANQQADAAASYTFTFSLADQLGPDRYSIVAAQLYPACRSKDGYVRYGQSQTGSTDYTGTHFESSFPALRHEITDVEDGSSPSFMNDDFGSYAYLSDEHFEGETVEIVLTLRADHFADLRPYFRVVVTNWSQELWDYYVSVFRHDPFYEDIFSERRTTVYSNIDNGLGVFAEQPMYPCV